MTCHRAVAPSPPPPPASKIACCSRASAWLLWIPLTSSAVSTRPGKTCILGCYYRAWHCLLPCLLSSRSQLGISTANLLHFYQPGIQAFPGHAPYISSCCIATTTVASSHRAALRFAIQVAGAEARKLSFLHPLSPHLTQATRSVLHSACSSQVEPFFDLLDLSVPGWTAQVHLHTLPTTVDVSMATMTKTTPPLARETPLPL
jgi:hypothetical protein